MRLFRQGKTVFVEDGESVRPLREYAAEEIEDLLLNVGPLGRVAAMFGYHPETYVLYLLKSSDDKPALREGARVGRFPLFRLRAVMWSRGTLQQFWEEKENKPFTKRLAAAMQYYVDGDNVVLTHMAVRPALRRNRVNSLLVEVLQSNHPGKTFVFDDPTEMGSKFMKGRGFAELFGPED